MLFLRKIVQLVEQWFSKPKVKGSDPFFPEILNINVFNNARF